MKRYKQEDQDKHYSREGLGDFTPTCLMHIK